MEQKEVREVKKVKEASPLFLAVPSLVFQKHLLPQFKSLSEMATFLHYAAGQNINQGHSVLIQNRMNEVLAPFRLLTPPSAQNINAHYEFQPLPENSPLFLTDLIQNPKAIPDPISFEHYRSIGMPPADDTTKDPSEVFNPLLWLHLNGNTALLKKIYDQAVKHFQNQTELTDTSHESFNFSLGISMALYKLDVIAMNHFVMAQWAICTYQPTDEFDKHFEYFRENIKNWDRKNILDWGIKKLLDYANAMQNTVMITHLPSIKAKRALPVKHTLLPPPKPRITTTTHGGKEVLTLPGLISVGGRRRK